MYRSWWGRHGMSIEPISTFTLVCKGHDTNAADFGTVSRRLSDNLALVGHAYSECAKLERSRVELTGCCIGNSGLDKR